MEWEIHADEAGDFSRAFRAVTAGNPFQEHSPLLSSASGTFQGTGALGRHRMFLPSCTQHLHIAGIWKAAGRPRAVAGRKRTGILKDPLSIFPWSLHISLCLTLTPLPGPSGAVLPWPAPSQPLQAPRAVTLCPAGVHCISSPALRYQCKCHYCLLHVMPEAATSRGDVKIVIRTYTLWKPPKKSNPGTALNEMRAAACQGYVDKNGAKRARGPYPNPHLLLPPQSLTTEHGVQPRGFKIWKRSEPRLRSEEQIEQGT